MIFTLVFGLQLCEHDAKTMGSKAIPQILVYFLYKKNQV